MPSSASLGLSRAYPIASPIVFRTELPFLYPTFLHKTPDAATRPRSLRKCSGDPGDVGLLFSKASAKRAALTQAATCDANGTVEARRRRPSPKCSDLSMNLATSGLLKRPSRWQQTWACTYSTINKPQARQDLSDRHDNSALVQHADENVSFPATDRKDGVHESKPESFLETRRWRNGAKEYRVDSLAPHRNSAGKILVPGDTSVQATLPEQLELVREIREAEDKLEKARLKLRASMARASEKSKAVIARNMTKTSIHTTSGKTEKTSAPIVLTKDDYLNLVDLYFYTHKNRFEPDSPDFSPTPLVIDDYSFELSRNFDLPDSGEMLEAEDEDERVLKDVEEKLKSRQLHEIAVMQNFVDYLLNDSSSNGTLFGLYKRLPEPGVAYLPKGAIRLFLQRMATPRGKSERSMLRYLSLIDDMQRARLPITQGEWSSAIYLAGRSFGRVTDAEVASSFRIWNEMEHEAGVRASHVTFNILFDIAVRAGKFVLAETVLREMHSRGLHLNRLGRVSLIYYHGLRGDGDGVRQTYRDFVEAGEIVDTLVLNCVMASLIHAQEPVAAEQVYERMKQLQERLVIGKREDGKEILFAKHPPPGPTQLNKEMASNSLGRILVNAPRLKSVFPDHHNQLQGGMPLTPDTVTYRNLIFHHATTSGDLDRLTVLLHDMREQFGLPMTPLIYRHLFRGFANHGGKLGSDVKWSNRRLESVWSACLGAIKGEKGHEWSLKESPMVEDIGIPSMKEVESMSEAHMNAMRSPANTSRPEQTPWETFVRDMTTTPEEQQRRASVVASVGPFASPFFSANTNEVDEQGEEIDPHGGYAASAADATVRSESKPSSDVSVVRPNKWLVIWLIRAYAHCTGSRTKLEEIWGTMRRIWKPADYKERDHAVRVLRRALRQCDEKAAGLR